MNGADNTQQPVAQEHLLLIEAITTSLAPPFFYFFRSKDVLQGERFALKLRITNKGSLHFSGGTINDLKITYNSDSPRPIFDNPGPKIIDGLPIGASTEIECGTWEAYSSTTACFECKPTSIDKLAVSCYQKQPGSGELNLLPDNRWVDFLPVSTRLEAQQMITNKILIFLTIVTVIYYLVSIFVKFPIVKSDTSQIGTGTSPASNTVSSL